MVLVRVVEAVYENGVLRPLERLDLREGERVRIRIEEDLLTVARRIRGKALREGAEPSEVLSSERERF